jgi:hypothetical protein
MGVGFLLNRELPLKPKPWARDCGFVGAIKKAEVIEIAIETAEAGNVSVSNVGVSNVGG